MRWLSLFLFLISSNSISGQEIHEYMDLQIHPCIHIPYTFYGEGLQYFDKNDPPDLTFKHLITNVNYANYLRKNKGARILVVGSLTEENIASNKRARKMILKQIDFVDQFVAENSEDFAIARSPKEVRELVHSTDKTIFVHSIEGGKRLINSQADADFWAGKGVAFVTLIHLVDSDLGGAAIKPGFIPSLLNFHGLFYDRSKRGLTEKGKKAILWLANAGIMTDMTHMSYASRKDALILMEEHGIPPLVTHDLFRPIHDQPRGVPEEDLVRIYKNNGLMSLPISGETCRPYGPRKDYQNKVDALEKYCDGSIDSYKFTYLEVLAFLKKSLTAEEFEELSLGFQTDFNGGLIHHHPRYGDDGCFEAHPDSTYEDIELLGLAHPGLLESHWRLLEKEGVDLEPVKRSSEKFLQMWEYFLENKGKFN